MKLAKTTIAMAFGAVAASALLSNAMAQDAVPQPETITKTHTMYCSTSAPNFLSRLQAEEGERPFENGITFDFSDKFKEAEVGAHFTAGSKLQITRNPDDPASYWTALLIAL